MSRATQHVVPAVLMQHVVIADLVALVCIDVAALLHAIERSPR
jgi:hypothetical protein